MTALFIITLVLFVLSYKMFKDKEAGLIALQGQLDQRSLQIAEQEEELEEMRGYLLTERQLADSLVSQLESEKGKLLVMEAEFRKLREIEEAVSALDPQLFEYQSEYKRHILKTQVQFQTGSASIPQRYHDMLNRAGEELASLIDSLEKKQNIKYLLVIEGSASKDDYSRNYELSYERALSLYQLWNAQGIDFDQDIIQVIISGSGTGGVGRAQNNEKLNQRFLIQIIPKVGTIDMVDWEALEEISGQMKDSTRQQEEEGFWDSFF